MWAADPLEPQFGETAPDTSVPGAVPLPFVWGRFPTPGSPLSSRYCALLSIGGLQFSVTEPEDRILLLVLLPSGVSIEMQHGFQGVAKRCGGI